MQTSSYFRRFIVTFFIFFNPGSITIFNQVKIKINITINYNVGKILNVSIMQSTGWYNFTNKLDLSSIYCNIMYVAFFEDSVIVTTKLFNFIELITQYYCKKTIHRQSDKRKFHIVNYESFCMQFLKKLHSSIHAFNKLVYYSVTI